MPDLVPLHVLRCGETAEVVDVLGLPEQVHRLKELGLRDGVGVEMVRSGKPCIIRVTGQTLCFRADEWLRVLVRPTAVPA